MPPRAKMKLKPVDAIPKRQGRSQYVTLLQQFLNGKDKQVEVENASKNAATPFRAAAKNLGVTDKVEIRNVGGSVYLIKK